MHNTNSTCRTPTRWSGPETPHPIAHQHPPAVYIASEEHTPPTPKHVHISVHKYILRVYTQYKSIKLIRYSHTHSPQCWWLFPFSLQTHHPKIYSAPSWRVIHNTSICSYVFSFSLVVVFSPQGMHAFSGTERWNMIWHNRPSPPGFQSPSLPTTVNATKHMHFLVNSMKCFNEIRKDFQSSFGVLGYACESTCTTGKMWMKSKPWIWWGSSLWGHFILGRTDTIFSVRALQSRQKQNKTLLRIQFNPSGGKRAPCSWLYYGRSCGLFFPLTFSGQWWNFPGRADRRLYQSCM